MEEDGTDRFERADTDSRRTHTHTAQETDREREGGRASVANKQKTLDATLFNSQYGSDDDQRYLNNYKNYPRAQSANKIPPVLSGSTLGLGVDAAEISSWRNPPFGG